MHPDLDRQLSDLLRCAQNGDRRAYEVLLREVASLVREFVRHRLGGSALVDDVVQDTLLSIHRARHTYDPARPFGPWMYAIARHRLLDVVDKQRRVREAEVLDCAGVDAIAVATSRDDADPAGFLRRALARLSRNQREVIRMLKLEDRSVAEIAARTGLTISAVKVTAHRGYKKLRELIGSPARA